MGIMHHKWIHYLLAGSLMFTAMPAFAAQTQTSEVMSVKPVNTSTQDVQAMENAKISKEKALEIAKNAIGIPEGYTQRNVEFQSKGWSSNSPAWIFFWDHQGPKYGNIQVTVDANTGNILNLGFYTNNLPSDTTYPPKVDLTKAKEIALSYIKKHFPDKVDQIIYDDRLEQQKQPLNGPFTYPVVFKRVVNGIMFDNDEVRVTVTGSGDIINLDYHWNGNIKFPSPSDILSMDQALENYKDHLHLTLHLLRNWGPRANDQKDFLGYMASTVDGGPGYNIPNSMIRASDGVSVTPWGEEIKQEQMQRLAEQKLGELPQTNGKSLTQEQAYAILKQTFHLAEDLNIVRASFREQNSDTPTSVWDFNWEVKSENVPNSWASASVDAITGRVLNYYSGERRIYDVKMAPETNGEDKEDSSLSRAVGEKNAIKLVEKLNPDLVQDIYLQHVPLNPYEMQKSPVYNYQFQLVKNGVSLEGASINVGINAKTGEISTYMFDPYNLRLPEQSPQVASLDQARKAYLDMVDMRLTYVLKQEKPQLFSKVATTPSTEAMLVYTPRIKELGEPIYLDAKTGVWSNRETGKALHLKNNVTDIKGNPYEKELNLLLNYNVFDVKEGKIYPNEEISRGEMIKILMLVQSNGHQVLFDPNRDSTFRDVPKNSPYFSYVENAIDLKWIDPTSEEFKPEEKISREDLANLIVNALGYGSLTEVPSLFTLDLKDISGMKFPAAAELVTKLGIMNSQGGKFLPENHVTRAEAAGAFYQFLNKKNNGNTGIRYK